jgi:nifR3 family TIM-barrel protein
MKNFWKELKKPIFVLAPLADVTDVAFRRVIAKYGKPHVMWTEFVSADGLARAPEEGRKKLMKDLEYHESERPIVAQLFSSVPEYMEQAARLCQDLGFDGIDINMGCPDKGIEKQGCGAAMIKNPAKAREIIRAAMKGAPNIPVSVKTRIGYNKNEIDTWLPELLAEKPAAITLHCRTRKEMSKVPARWEHIREATELRDKISPETLIIGNGDIIDLTDAENKCREFGADGAMLGRAIFGNPWLFAEIHAPHPTLPLVRGGQLPSRFPLLAKEGIKGRLEVMLEHTKLFQELLGDTKSFALMKKHYKAYVNDFEGAKELRIKLMETENYEQVEEIVNNFLSLL